MSLKGETNQRRFRVVVFESMVTWIPHPHSPWLFRYSQCAIQAARVLSMMKPSIHIKLPGGACKKKKQSEGIKSKQKKKRTCQILCNLGLPSTLKYSFQISLSPVSTSSGLFNFAPSSSRAIPVFLFVCFLSLRMTFLKKPWKKRLQEGDRNMPAKDPG